MPATRGLGFLGRASEREVLDGMLARAHDGHSAVLVIRGETGIGKTALLRYAARQAAGLRLAHVEGVQAEIELPYAGIHRLCAPLLDGLAVLPEPQSNALRVALGLAPGDPPDRFLVALAVLSLLCATAEERPLLCLVDDAHWLDAASSQAIGFVARRLLAESVALVCALREPAAGHAFDGLPQVMLGGLDDADARALLSRAVPGRLDDRVRDRVVAESRGNPLALIELSRSMSAAERAGGYGTPAAGDLPGQLQAQFVRRVGELPAPTRRVLLLAAAEPLGDATVVWRAAERLAIDPGALAPAAQAGLLEIDDRVRFRHPLVRAAVYRAAPPEERRRVHGALADASDPELEADRRAWHRALAAAAPDEAVAAELEQSTRRARTRGGLAAAAAFLERATALTTDPALRGRRALGAAQLSLQAGASDTALALAAVAEAETLGESERAQLDLLRGQVAFAGGRGDDAPRLLLQAARRLEPLDQERARETYLTAWAAVRLSQPADDDLLVEICRAARGLPRPAGEPRALDLLLEGLALLATDGRAAAAPTLRRAAEALKDIPVADILRWGWVAPGAAMAVWDHESLAAIAERQVRLVRDAGALSQLPIQLTAASLAHTLTGDFAGAAALVAESESVATATSTTFPCHTAVLLRALRGSELAATDGEPAYARWATAVLCNGLARYDEAAEAARDAAAKRADPWYSMWALAELVEAAARTQDAELARDALARLADETRPCPTDWARGITARCAALVADGDAAERLYREAIERLGRTRLRPDLARAHLVFGEWLHRAGQVAHAREQLRTADDMFAAIGMEAFGDRARRALLATGATARRQVATRSEELTPQEEQIARLARDGLTNAEIGAQLFLSPRTVEWHLHKVFAKLGVSSRSGLQAPRSEG